MRRLNVIVGFAVIEFRVYIEIHVSTPPDNRQVEDGLCQSLNSGKYMHSQIWHLGLGQV